MNFLEHLRCPITGNKLQILKKEQFIDFNIPVQFNNFGELSEGLIDTSKQFFYPIFDDIIVLHSQYATCIGGEQLINKLELDKQRVFDYYNQVNYLMKDKFRVFGDGANFVDVRDVSTDYLCNSFTQAGKYFPKKGKYMLDIASGPIGLPEYIALSDGYEYRICVDISINALLGAKYNLTKINKKGIYICGDITNIPIEDNIVDTVLCQHTLYHIPRKEQETAVREMYRVAKSGTNIVIVYEWFYHSWLMNLTLNVTQIYRVVRHYAGKLYVRLFKTSPKLYFYAHSKRWFLRTFNDMDLEFYTWRSLNINFLKLYIHPKLGGRRILQWFQKMEEKHNKFMSTFGCYAVIVIKKHK